MPTVSGLAAKTDILEAALKRSGWEKRAVRYQLLHQ